MAPTLVASYAITPASQTLNTLTTPSFSPSNGEVLVVKLYAWGLTSAMGAPTGGAQTYTSRAASTQGGTFPAVSIYTAVVTGSPGSMTISSTPALSSYHGMVVERWSGAALAASPATVNTFGATTTVSATITTAAANSIVSWVSGDGSSKDPTGAAYLSSATQDGLLDGHVGSNSVGYFAYQSAPTAGSQTVGISAPTPQSWTLVGIEVQAAASVVSGDVSQTITQAVTAAGVSAAVGAAAQTVTQTVTAAGVNAAAGGATPTVTATTTAAGANATTGGAAQTVTAGVTAAGSNATSGAATQTTAATVTASAVAGSVAALTAALSVVADAVVTAGSRARGSWWQLKDIAVEAAAMREAFNRRPPQACPNDGEPLEQGRNGILHCRFDGWQYPRDYVRPG
jgi:hypothetical protein